jgi:hypothetical protein
MRKPYWICGGLQDNGSWCGPSATLYTDGITNEDWFRVAGGDGFYVQVDPNDAATVYAESQDGNLLRRDLRSNEARVIRPEPKESEPRYRFQWNSPVVISAHDSKTLYYGGNFFFKSTDRGDTWTRLSGDLTTGVDRSKLPILGKVPDENTLSRHDGVQAYPTITTLSESPLTSAVLWVGTDDGNLQVTRDASQTWRNVAERVPGVPKGTYVSRVVASRYAEGTAYVTFDGHRSNDFNVYVFMTADYGETWKPITHVLPANNGTAHVIREHPRNPNLLFVGTEYGAYVSLDRGANWTALKMNLPTVPVDDIAIHPRDNDLIFGTHGRSIWVLDDVTPLEQLDAQVLGADLYLFDIRPATAWRIYGHKGNTGHKFFQAPNPAYGALINYSQKSKPDEKTKVSITVLDRDAKVVRELEGKKEAGINHVNWDLRYTPPAEPSEEERRAMEQGFGFGPRGPLVEPGEYTVRISVGSNEVSKTVRVEEDPRINVSPADRATRRVALMRLYELRKTAERGQRTVTGLKASLAAAMEAWKKPGASKVPENIRKAVEALAKRVDELHGKFVPARDQLGNAGPPLVYTPPPFARRIGQLSNAIEGYTAAPTSQQAEALEALARLLGEATDQLKKLVDEDLANLNRMMNEAGIPHISVAAPAEGGRRRER